MPSEAVISLYLMGGVAAVVGIGFAFQPITGERDFKRSKAKESVQEQVESKYCRLALSGVNCTCFATKSALIAGEGRADIHGAQRMPARDLARQQAATSC